MDLLERGVKMKTKSNAATIDMAIRHYVDYFVNHKSEMIYDKLQSTPDNKQVIGTVNVNGKTCDLFELNYIADNKKEREVKVHGYYKESEGNFVLHGHTEFGGSYLTFAHGILNGAARGRDYPLESIEACEFDVNYKDGLLDGDVFLKEGYVNNHGIFNKFKLYTIKGVYNLGKATRLQRNFSFGKDSEDIVEIEEFDEEGVFARGQQLDEFSGEIYNYVYKEGKRVPLSRAKVSELLDEVETHAEAKAYKRRQLLSAAKRGRAVKRIVKNWPSFLAALSIVTAAVMITKGCGIKSKQSAADKDLSYLKVNMDKKIRN